MDGSVVEGTPRRRKRATCDPPIRFCCRFNLVCCRSIPTCRPSIRSAIGGGRAYSWRGVIMVGRNERWVDGSDQSAEDFDRSPVGLDLPLAGSDLLLEGLQLLPTRRAGRRCLAIGDLTRATCRTKESICAPPNWTSRRTTRAGTRWDGSITRRRRSIVQQEILSPKDLASSPDDAFRNRQDRRCELTGAYPLRDGASRPVDEARAVFDGPSVRLDGL